MAETWNLTDLYKTNEEYLQDFEIAKKLLKNLEKYRNKLNKKNKSIILSYLKQDTELSLILEKLAVYAHCKNDDDAKNQTNIKNYHTLSDFFTLANQKLAFVKTELSQLDDDFLNSLISDPDFSNYDLTFKEIIKDKPHTLTEKEEAQMSRISAFENSDDIYSTLSDIEMDHGSFVDENGNTVGLTTGNYNLLMKNPKQSERKKIQEAYLERYAKLNLTFANLYLSHVKYMNFVAKTYNHRSVLDMHTFDEDVSPKIMQTNINFVSSKNNLLQRYFELKRRTLNLSKFYTSDIGCDILPKTNVNTNLDDALKNIKLKDALKEIKSAFAVLGKDYQDMFEKAIKDGWIDAFPRQNKASGGYTISTYSVHPYILLNFDGTSYWKSAIAHEFGHAMHSFYSAKAQPYQKYDYTIFVAEVASLTNEILLENYLLETTTDVKEKILLLADFLQLFYLNVYNSTLLAEFELYVHKSLDNGKTLTGSDLNKKYISICKRYFGKAVHFTKNFEADWSRKSHIFSDYYLYKYSTGLISACYIAQKILNDKTGSYVKKYKEFLSLGCSLDPAASLKVAGVDILSEEPYNFAFNMFEKYLNKLEKLLKEDL